MTATASAAIGSAIPPGDVTPSKSVGDPRLTVQLSEEEVRRMREGVERLQEESGKVSEVDGLVVGMALGALVHEPVVGGVAGLAGAHWLRKRR